jgi:uncharacterized protein YdeI (YjbR/CyaY-like superfamily)
MPPVQVDPDKVHEFADERAFHDWLARHHATQDEVWIKLHKVEWHLLKPFRAIFTGAGVDCTHGNSLF